MVNRIVADYPYPQYDSVTGRMLLSVYIRLRHIPAVFETIPKCELMEISVPYKKLMQAAVLIKDYDTAIFAARQVMSTTLETSNIWFVGEWTFPWMEIMEACKTEPSFMTRILQLLESFPGKVTLHIEIAHTLCEWSRRYVTELD